MPRLVAPPKEPTRDELGNRQSSGLGNVLPESWLADGRAKRVVIEMEPFPTPRRVQDPQSPARIAVEAAGLIFSIAKKNRPRVTRSGPTQAKQRPQKCRLWCPAKKLRKGYRAQHDRVALSALPIVPMDPTTTPLMFGCPSGRCHTPHESCPQRSSTATSPSRSCHRTISGTRSRKRCQSHNRRNSCRWASRPKCRTFPH